MRIIWAIQTYVDYEPPPVSRPRGGFPVRCSAPPPSNPDEISQGSNMPKTIHAHYFVVKINMLNWKQVSPDWTVLAALGMPPPCILTPLPCPLLGPALLPGPAPLTAPLTAPASLTAPLTGPLALTLPRPDITVFVFFCFCFQKHHSSKSSFYNATDSKSDWNQLWFAQFTQHKSAVCQWFNSLFIISWDILF